MYANTLSISYQPNEVPARVPLIKEGIGEVKIMKTELHTLINRALHAISCWYKIEKRKGFDTNYAGSSCGVYIKYFG